MLLSQFLLKIHCQPNQARPLLSLTDHALYWSADVEVYEVLLSDLQTVSFTGDVLRGSLDIDLREEGGRQQIDTRSFHKRDLAAWLLDLREKLPPEAWNVDERVFAPLQESVG